MDFAQNLAPREHLLFVDDEIEITRSLARLFRKEYIVHQAQSAEEAYECIAEHPVQVVVADQRMPGTDGVTCLTQIKQDHPQIVRLILTGYADSEAIMRAINEAKIFKLISKPWDPDRLASSLRLAFDHYWEQGYKYQLNRHLRMMQLRGVSEVLSKADQLLQRNHELIRVMAKHGLSRYAPFLSQSNSNSDTFRKKSFVHEFHASKPEAEVQETVDPPKMDDLLKTWFPSHGIGDMDWPKWWRHLSIDLQSLAQAKNCTLAFGEPPPPLRADGLLLRHALIQMVQNALQASERGGHITVQAKPDGALQVCHRGQGPSEEKCRAISQALRSGNLNAMDSHWPLGIGLTLVKLVAQAHGGWADFECDAMSGVTTTLTWATSAS